MTESNAVPYSFDSRSPILRSLLMWMPKRGEIYWKPEAQSGNGNAKPFRVMYLTNFQSTNQRLVNHVTSEIVLFPDRQIAMSG
jgi:hypothetical protein